MRRVTRRLATLLVRAVQALRILGYRCLSNNRVEGRPTRYQPIHAVGLGKILCHDGVKLGVFPSPFFLTSCAYLEARKATSSISIGEGTWINNNFSAIAEHTSISIGRNCLIGLSVEIIDSDFHGLAVAERRVSRPGWARAVSVGNDVFIGSHVKIMKGVTIGDGAVVANGSLVTKDVPPGVVAAGNPARVIREIE